MAGPGRRRARCPLPRLRACARQRRCAFAAVRHRLLADGLRRRAVRAQPEADRRAVGRLLLRRRRHRRGVRRRPRDGFHLLGADGDRLDGRHLERRPVRPGRRTALRRDPSVRRHPADGRHRRPDRRHRFAGLWPDDAQFGAPLADPRRFPGQCRRAAFLVMAARCLCRELVERHGLPVGLHHQDGGLRSSARVPRDRAPDLSRPVHGVLRHRLRDPGERHAAHPGLQHRQPGRLHGDGGRHRHGNGAQRRRRARLRPHHLQGAAADVGGLGALHDGQAQVHRPRRPVPDHAHHRRSAASSAPCRSRRFR